MKKLTAVVLCLAFGAFPVIGFAQGDPVKGAKGLIGKMIAMQDPKQLGDLFTNESAAAMGTFMMIPVAMMAGMADSMPGGKQGQAKAIEKELEGISKRYGLDMNKPPMGGALPKQLTSNGRAFMKDMFGMLDKFGKQNGKPGAAGNGFTKTKDMPKSPEEVTYKVLSPTRVKMVPKKPMKSMGPMDSIEARWEDNQWRLHFGNFQEMMSKAKFSGGPPAGGAPPKSAPRRL